MSVSYTTKRLPSMDILLGYDELHHELDNAIQNGDLEEAKELENEIEAFDKRWSLSCYST